MIKRLFAIALLAASLVAQETAPPPAPAAPPVDDEFTKAVFFGRRYFDRQDYTSAYEQFAKADQIRPDQPAVLYNMAVVLAKAGRYSEAQVKVDRYVQLFPAGAERQLVNQLSLELDFQRDVQRKRQADEQYAELFNRGKFLYGRNELDAALKAFQEAEQRRPNDPAAVFNQAIVYEKQLDYAKAVERFRRFDELETDAAQKTGLDQRLFALENELEDMRTKVVCSFCGHKLRQNATWCHRCWHGPYLTTSPVWNTRPCVEGASATRATYFSDDRFHKNDSLPCLFRDGTMLESMRYTPSRQRAIQAARKGEGWTYEGDVIQGYSNGQIRYAQGPEYLQRVVAAGGEILEYEAHKAGDVWLLDREDLIVDNQKYVARYTFDPSNRILSQQVEYQNASACGHLITETADFVYQNDALVSVKLKGGYEGFRTEGAPKLDWEATIAYAYDGMARVVKEELAVTSFNKTYTERPIGAMREEISKLYLGMRTDRPIQDSVRRGDLCATIGASLLSNPIDLRPFYTISPNLAVALQPGVVKAVVTFTYPDAYRIR